MAQTNVESVFTAYAKLTPNERAQFDAMKTGYEIRTRDLSNAGKKAAATKKDGKAKAAGGAEA